MKLIDVDQTVRAVKDGHRDRYGTIVENYQQPILLN